MLLHMTGIIKEWKLPAIQATVFCVKHFHQKRKFLAVETSQQTNTSTLYFADASASMGEPDGALSMFVEKQFLCIEDGLLLHIHNTNSDLCCCHCHLQSVVSLCRSISIEIGDI